MLLTEILPMTGDESKQYETQLLSVLLFDWTTQKNIIWATDTYKELGEGYGFAQEIRPESIRGEHEGVIRRRREKSSAAQDGRTRDKAEVFTPSWVCNKQNNLIDAAWFSRENVFNTETPDGWIVNEEKIEFPKTRRKYPAWTYYVNALRLEVSCGEAPYLVSRYDAVTGEKIPLKRRIGLLDRKLRVVSENTTTAQNWLFWAERAVRSVYGYEYQGDSLLLARENLLMTYAEYYEDRFKEAPPGKLLLKMARSITRNLWQMDGIKYVVPGSCRPILHEGENLFDGDAVTEEPCPGCTNADVYAHTGRYCRLYDWRSKKWVKVVEMLKGGHHE